MDNEKTLKKLSKRIKKISDKLNKKICVFEEVCRVNGADFEKEVEFLTLQLMKIEKIVEDM